MQKLLPLLLLSYVVTPAFIGQESVAAQTISANVADLKQQLESGLKARRPQEFAFIATVVEMVSNDHLPLDLVMSTFIWTRQNPQAKEYPFVYFQRALRERAKKLGITV
ncbi:MAG TPA: hypothetical protein VMM76_10015 [Pirellulaceae bacterium]|nr:hypothetical protein [Pirellulaceae bacterium]